MDTAIVFMEAVCALRDYMAASVTCVSTNLTPSSRPLHNDHMMMMMLLLSKNKILMTHHLHSGLIHYSNAKVKLRRQMSFPVVTMGVVLPPCTTGPIQIMSYQTYRKKIISDKL